MSIIKESIANIKPTRIRYSEIIVAVITTFLYLFPFKIKALPLSPLVLLLLISICYFIVAKKITFTSAIFDYIKYSAAISIYLIFTSLLNDSYDFTHYFGYYVTCIAFPIIALFLVRIHRLEFRTTLILIVACVLLQCVIALLLFFIPSFQELVLKKVDYSYSGEAYEIGFKTRLFGLGTEFFGMGAILGLTLLCLIWLIGFCHDKFIAFLLTLFFWFIFIVGLFASRSILIAGLIALSYSILNRTSYFYLFSLILVVPSALLLIEYSNSSGMENYFRFAFEFIYNYNEKGAVSTDSSNELQLMYRNIDLVKTWFIGDSRFSMPDGTYYGSTDAGFMRQILSYGLIGTFMTISVYLWSFRVAVKKIPESYSLFFLIFIFYLVMNIKGMMFFASAADKALVLILVSIYAGKTSKREWR